MSKISVPTGFISPVASFLLPSLHLVFSLCAHFFVFSSSHKDTSCIALGPHPSGLILMSSPLIGPVSK